ncbi:tRNA (adenosine(37)-N6)-dimethylallyltransferase MiaA [bacterium]|nr:tRNA (adenosine(37)-N6)-dimethylallyltransferase MiaA [bacterium]
MKNCLIAITGPTASGKTRLAIELAKQINAEIISCDSRQIYREFDIATAKPSLEEQDGIIHHLFDIISPQQTFSASDFNDIAQQKIEEIWSCNKNVIVVGGTGFYFRILLEGLTLTNVAPNEQLRKELQNLAEENGKEAVFKILENLDLEASKKIHFNNLDKVIRAIEICKTLNMPMSEAGQDYKPKYNVLWIGLDFKDRQKLYDRINLRVDEMLRNGLENEAKNLFKKYGQISSLMGTIGYQEFLPYFNGEVNYEEVTEKIKQNTRHYAKRQLTWFRSNKKMNWFYPDEECFENIFGKVLKLYELSCKI